PQRGCPQGPATDAQVAPETTHPGGAAEANLTAELPPNAEHADDTESAWRELRWGRRRSKIAPPAAGPFRRPHKEGGVRPDHVQAGMSRQDRYCRLQASPRGPHRYGFLRILRRRRVDGDADGVMVGDFLKGLAERCVLDLAVELLGHLQAESAVSRGQHDAVA